MLLPACTRQFFSRATVSRDKSLTCQTLPPTPIFAVDSDEIGSASSSQIKSPNVRPTLKLWQVEHEIIKLASRFLPNICRLRVVKLDITLKPLNRFLYAAYHLKEETLSFLSVYKNNQSR